MKFAKGDKVRLNNIGRYRLSHMVAAYSNTDWDNGIILEPDSDGIANVVEFLRGQGISTLPDSFLESNTKISPET
jgi:hypothetical protein